MPFLSLPTSLDSLDSPLNHHDDEIRNMVQIDVRLAAAMAQALDPSTPTDVLRQLADLDDFYIRMKAAESPALPEDVLLELAADPFVQVRQAAAENPVMPPAGLRMLARLGFSQTPGSERAAAAHPNCPVELLETLACTGGEKASQIATDRLRELEDHTLTSWHTGSASRLAA